MSGLTFVALNFANVARCYEVFHPLDEWSPTDWACAAGGELGEAQNLIKKVRRGECVDRHEIAEELADAVFYIDLLCVRMGVNLEEAIVKKFNKTSSETGSAYRLADPTEPEEL